MNSRTANILMKSTLVSVIIYKSCTSQRYNIQSDRTCSVTTLLCRCCRLIESKKQNTDFVQSATYLILSIHGIISTYSILWQKQLQPTKRVKARHTCMSMKNTSAESESCGCRRVDTLSRQAHDPYRCTTIKRQKRHKKWTRNQLCLRHKHFISRLLTIASKSTCSSTSASEISAAWWKWTLSERHRKVVYWKRRSELITC